MKYYSKKIYYGRKKIKKFWGGHIEYYAEDKLHGIVIKIKYTKSYFGTQLEEPQLVLKKYMESIHKQHLIKE